MASVPHLKTDDLQAFAEGGGHLEWQSIRTERYYTNAFIWIPSQGKILLGYKKRGFGKDMYNGFGGKVEAGEQPIVAAARELQEEAGIEADLKHCGTLLFFAPNEEGFAHHIEIYRAHTFTGEVTESEEMRPEWFALPAEYRTGAIIPDLQPQIADIPYDIMWEDDTIWFPKMFEGKFFRGRVDFAAPGDGGKMLKWWFGSNLF